MGIKREVLCAREWRVSDSEWQSYLVIHPACSLLCLWGDISVFVVREQDGGSPFLLPGFLGV